MATSNGSTAIRDKILASLARYRALRIGKFPCAFWRLSSRPGLTAKAKTACLFGMPTGQIGQLSQPEGPLFGIEHSNDGLITFPGGLPIVNSDGILIGAIGVSGSSVENDHIVALAGAQIAGVSDLPEHPWRT